MGELEQFQATGLSLQTLRLLNRPQDVVFWGILLIVFRSIYRIGSVCLNPTKNDKISDYVFTEYVHFATKAHL